MRGHSGAPVRSTSQRRMPSVHPTKGAPGAPTPRYRWFIGVSYAAFLVVAAVSFASHAYVNEGLKREAGSLRENALPSVHELDTLGTAVRHFQVALSRRIPQLAAR